MMTLALQIQFVVLNWQVYQFTHDYLSLGLLGLFEAIPAVGLALFGGFVSDRNDRRKILVIIMGLQTLLSLALLGISIYYERSAGISTAIPFYVIMFFVGLLRAFYSPAQFPLMTQLVPREAYANSSAWNSTFWHIGVVVGSACGGLMLGYLGATVTYSTVIVMLVIAFIQIVRIPPQKVNPVKVGESMGQSIRQGINFVFSNQMIFGAMLLDLIAVLFGGATAMLPVFASEILHVGEKGFGFLRAAPFIGSVLMALYMTKHPPMKSAGKKLTCVAGFSVCMIAFALSSNFYLSMAILALSGAFDNVSVVIRSTIVQYFTPDDMRGRVSSVSTMFISSSNEIGAFESGSAAKLIGLVPSVIAGGIIAITSVGASMVFLPKLRELDLDKEHRAL
ncbi:MAG: MFS transporter [Bacteroidetes bacterium]|nr:MFS transporter [Bacteroidota bacterium]